LAGLGECHAYLGNDDLARSYARQALQVTPEDGDPTTLSFAWHALGLVHSRLGEPRRAISCYRHALAFARKRENSMARKWLVSVLADFGDACQAAGDLPAATGAWQEALDILDDLRLPDDLGVRARLEQAGLPPPG
jgi:tetratricopeptide (TPR) repeat protein